MSERRLESTREIVSVKKKKSVRAVVSGKGLTFKAWSHMYLWGMFPIILEVQPLMFVRHLTHQSRWHGHHSTTMLYSWYHCSTSILNFHVIDIWNWPLIKLSASLSKFYHTVICFFFELDIFMNLLLSKTMKFMFRLLVENFKGMNAHFWMLWHLSFISK